MSSASAPATTGSMMPRRRLPGTDLDVSVLCLGSWAFGGTEEQPDATHGFIEGGQTAINAIVAAALESGINFFDTAEAYADHRAERALGAALRASGAHRGDYIVASKFGRHKGSVDIAYDGPAVRAALAATLDALGLDMVDLYQVHWAGNMASAAEVAAVLIELQREGKIRHFGLCNFGVQQMAAFDEATAALSRGTPLVTTNQLPYNLLWRAIEHDILPRCARDGWGVLAYGPFQEGLLCGKYQTVEDVPVGRRRTKHFAMGSSPLSRHGGGGAEEPTFAAIRAVEKACADAAVPTMQAAVSWLLRQPAVASVIMGCSSARQVRANAALVGLSDAHTGRLSCATEELKIELGADADMWGAPSRIC